MGFSKKNPKFFKNRLFAYLPQIATEIVKFLKTFKIWFFYKKKLMGFRKKIMNFFKSLKVAKEL